MKFNKKASLLAALSTSILTIASCQQQPNVIQTEDKKTSSNSQQNNVVEKDKEIPSQKVEKEKQNQIVVQPTQPTLVEKEKTPSKVVNSNQTAKEDDKNKEEKSTSKDKNKQTEVNVKPEPKQENNKEDSKVNNNQENNVVNDESKIEKASIFEPSHKEKEQNPPIIAKPEPFEELKNRIQDVLINAQKNQLLVAANYGELTANDTYQKRVKANDLIDITPVIDATPFFNIEEIKNAFFYITKKNNINNDRGFIEPETFIIKKENITLEFKNIRIIGFKPSKPELIEMERILVQKTQIDERVFKFSPSLVGLTLLNSTKEAGFQKHKDYFNDEQSDPEFWFQEFENVIKSQYQILNPRLIDFFLEEKQQEKYQVKVTGFEADDEEGILIFETTITPVEDPRGNIVPLSQKWIIEGFTPVNFNKIANNFGVYAHPSILKLRERAKSKYYNSIKAKLETAVKELRDNGNSGEIDIMKKFDNLEIYNFYISMLDNVNYYFDNDSEVFTDLSNQIDFYNKFIKKTSSSIGFMVVPTPMQVAFIKDLRNDAIISENNIMELIGLKLVFENDDYTLKANLKINTRFIRSKQWVNFKDNELTFEPEITTIRKTIDIPIRYFQIAKQ